MPSTTNFSWTTPADTDLVKDGALAIRTLGNGIDTSFVDLKGGTTGQILSKATNTDLDFTWVASEKSNLVPKNTGRYIKLFTTVALTEITLTEDTTYYSPIYLPGYALDRISCRVGASHTGTSTARLGLYNVDLTTGLPSTVYLDAGTVACTGTNTNFEITIANTPPAGYYYFAINAQTITGVPSFAAMTAANTHPYFYVNTTATVNTTTYMTGFSEASITGAFATAGSLTVNTGNYILNALRMA